jgi:hypothetical protein
LHRSPIDDKEKDGKGREGQLCVLDVALADLHTRAYERTYMSAPISVGPINAFIVVSVRT